MNYILADLWQRLIKEARITVAGAGEAVLAVSERVNRKTQMLRLHWQAAAFAHQMDNVARTVGHALCDLAVSSSVHDTGMAAAQAAAGTDLLQGATAVRLLKQELTRVEDSIRELEVEVLLEDMLKIQRDLTTRSAGFFRLVVASDSSAIGLSLAQLNLPVAVHAAALLRGPALLSPIADIPIQAGDILILLGPQADLQRVTSHFTSLNRAESRSAKARQYGSRNLPV